MNEPTAVERVVRAWVLHRIPREFKDGASAGVLTRRYGLTRDAVEQALRLFMRRSVRKGIK